MQQLDAVRYEIWVSLCMLWNATSLSNCTFAYNVKVLVSFKYPNLTERSTQARCNERLQPVADHVGSRLLGCVSRPWRQALHSGQQTSVV